MRGGFGMDSRYSYLVIPANAGIQSVRRLIFPRIPAFAGMTKGKDVGSA